MFQNPKQEIKNATTLAEKAVTIFNKTVDELRGSNDKLLSVIKSENEKIAESEQHIIVATEHIKSNNAIISKLKEFITT